MTDEISPVADGDRCRVIAGTHKGRSGTIEDLNRSKGGNITVTVRDENQERFKTLARNVEKD